jgi:hypothetical protein
MAVEINGTTGVSLVQDGVVTAADLSSTLDLTGKTITLPAANSPGLTLVTSGTCADTQTLTVDNCFTSTYLNYKIHLNLNLADYVTNDQNLDFYLRLRSGGSTITTSNYHWSRGVKNLGVNSNFDSERNNAASSIKILDNTDAGNTQAVGWIDFYAPASSDGSGKTFIMSELFSFDSPNEKIEFTHASYAVDAAVDGFALSTFNGNGNFDGTYQVYGYAL